mmetsp:Transcript_15009/g.49224  ORF Transcript_15009/g.49224 Transcript_15009/m.49224 type:complete len:237 (+) Transcript_15009:727-1437(+)
MFARERQHRNHVAVATQRRRVQGAVSFAVCVQQIRARLEQLQSTLCMPTRCCDRQGAVPCNVRQVDVHFTLYQRAHRIQMAKRCSSHERGGAFLGFRILGRPRFDERNDGFGMALFGSFVDERVASRADERHFSSLLCERGDSLGVPVRRRREQNLILGRFSRRLGHRGQRACGLQALPRGFFRHCVQGAVPRNDRALVRLLNLHKSNVRALEIRSAHRLPASFHRGCRQLSRMHT